MAKALHQLSGSGKRLVAVNCSSITESLAESELFGHVNGAFAGANQDKVGVFEYADGETAMLDEIGEMPLGMQAKLLRVLQNHEVQRVGSPAVTKGVDVVVAATNRDLQMMSRQENSEDLYFRLSAVELKVPSLANRAEDLPLLERHFLKAICGSIQQVHFRSYATCADRARALSLAGQHTQTAERDRAFLHDDAIGCD